MICWTARFGTRTAAMLPSRTVRRVPVSGSVRFSESHAVMQPLQYVFPRGFTKTGSSNGPRHIEQHRCWRFRRPSSPWASKAASSRWRFDGGASAASAISPGARGDFVLAWCVYVCGPVCVRARNPRASGGSVQQQELAPAPPRVHGQHVDDDAAAVHDPMIMQIHAGVAVRRVQAQLRADHYIVARLEIQNTVLVAAAPVRPIPFHMRRPRN